ncbi:MAG: stage II sporulation protein M [Defluviitaleaceae bacterium]|nr:stage II sporulation protein M [Defluviitaleaceae bacterium]
MTETQFIKQNEERWQQLEAFNLTLQRKGINTLSRLEIRAFAETFRAVGYHLAYARTHFPDGKLIPYLSHIVGVANNFYYVRERGNFRAVKNYFLYGFPKAVRETWLFTLVSAILFMLGMLFAYVYVADDINNFYRIFPGEFGGVNLGEGEVVWDYPLMSAIIMTNNIRVSIIALVFGITGGLGTIYILFYNGLIVGALAAYVDLIGSPGDTLIFWSLILPHGVPELLAIFISGAAGLIIGRSLLMPGNYTRKDAVIKGAKEAMSLVPGIVLILVLAGLIEGFFTPLGISPYFKLGFALLVAVGLGIYIHRVPKAR